MTDAAQGNREAFAELYRRYAGMVYAIALASLDAPAAEDVVQDVFLQALRRLPALRAPEKFGGWLAAIARNRVLDAYRRAAPEGRDVEVAVAAPHADRVEARAALDAIRALPGVSRDIADAPGPGDERARDCGAHGAHAGIGAGEPAPGHETAESAARNAEEQNGVTRPVIDDYLWEQTGEGDELIARIERLLAPLRYHPVKARVDVVLAPPRPDEPPPEA